jgi:putative transposase
MTWAEITRPRYERRCTHYASDLTDEEWARIGTPLPPERGCWSAQGNPPF